MNKKSIPGWTINIDEVSNGVFKVTLTDAYGRKAEIIDLATDETIERTISDAFDIEKQISLNWNLFLYDLAVQKLSDKSVEQMEYDEKSFRSWVIETHENRLIYDGKDSWLIFQTKTNGNWTDIDIIKKEDLNYSNFIKQLTRLLESNTPAIPSPKEERKWWQKLFGSK